MISLPSVVSCSDKHLIAEVDGQIVRLNADAGLSFGPNEVGTAIWHRLALVERLHDGQLVEVRQ